MEGHGNMFSCVKCCKQTSVLVNNRCFECDKEGREVPYERAHILEYAHERIMGLYLRAGKTDPLSEEWIRYTAMQAYQISKDALDKYRGEK